MCADEFFSWIRFDIQQNIFNLELKLNPSWNTKILHWRWFQSIIGKNNHECLKEHADHPLAPLNHLRYNDFYGCDVIEGQFEATPWVSKFSTLVKSSYYDQNCSVAESRRITFWKHVKLYIQITCLFIFVFNRTSANETTFTKINFNRIHVNLGNFTVLQR